MFPVGLGREGDADEVSFFVFFFCTTCWFENLGQPSLLIEFKYFCVSSLDSKVELLGEHNK